MCPASPGEATARRVPIGDYGLIGDTRSAALVAPDGSIDWWCVPRFDDPPLFGRLVGGDEAGSFSLGPGEDARLTGRAYRDDTVTLTTTWAVDGGELELADGLVAEVEGRFLPGTVLVRRLSARGRAVRARLHLAPRFGYDRQPARRISRRGGALVCERGERAIAVTCDGPTVEADRPVEFEVRPGEPVTIVLTATRRGPLIIVPPAVASAALTRDENGWRTWTAGIDVANHRVAVVRSLLTLQLLTYSPTGAPVAAPTTSLPEADRRRPQLGLPLRLAAGCLHRCRRLPRRRQAPRGTRPSSPGSSMPAASPDPVCPSCSRSTGDRVHPKPNCDGWPGYADSRPVRIGNGAAGQHQLDGYGWVVDAAWLLTDSGHRLYGEAWRAIAGFADQVAATWTEPDAGIWEKRATPAHHVHSKLMAWLSLDRAIRIAATRGDRRHRRLQRWIRARDAVATDVRARGFDPARNTYTGAYDSVELDASVLVLPVLGLEPATSPRVVGTVDAIRRQLGAGRTAAVPLSARHRRPRWRRRRLSALLVLARPSLGSHRPPRRSRGAPRRAPRAGRSARPLWRRDGSRHR